MCNYIILSTIAVVLTLIPQNIYARTITADEFGIPLLSISQAVPQPLPTVPGAVRRIPEVKVKGENPNGSHTSLPVFRFRGAEQGQQYPGELYGIVSRGLVLPLTHILFPGLNIPIMAFLAESSIRFSGTYLPILQYSPFHNPRTWFLEHLPLPFDVARPVRQSGAAQSGLKEVSWNIPQPAVSRINPLLPAGASVLLPPALGMPIITGAVLAENFRSYSRFSGDPFEDSIPETVQEVYTWDQLWNPAYNPQRYLQCTTYVAMVYNLNGISLKGRVYGDARDWIRFDDVFAVYASGKSAEPPRPLDVAVWAANGDNHVGVIIEAERDRITVANANASEPEYEFRLEYGADEAIVITNSDGETSEDAWVPSHWLRYDPQ